MDKFKIRCQKEWQENEYEKELWEWENTLSQIVLNTPGKKILFPGFCQICQKEVDFILDDKWSGSENCVNFRERMTCPICGLNNRMRAMMELISEFVDVEKDSIYMYEQVTTMFKHLERKCKNLIGSEYLDTEYEPGYITMKGIRHEDAMNLSFQADSFKCIISQDVFEHVSDIKKTLSESFRVLQNGGVMLISVPFYFDRYITEKRAEITNNKINYLKDPIYHGNPVSTEGSLVFYAYGWDLLDWIKDAGYSDAYFRKTYSCRNGNIGVNALAFLVAKK